MYVSRRATWKISAVALERASPGADRSLPTRQEHGEAVSERYSNLDSDVDLCFAAPTRDDAWTASGPLVRDDTTIKQSSVFAAWPRRGGGDISKIVQRKYVDHIHIKYHLIQTSNNGLYFKS